MIHLLIDVSIPDKERKQKLQFSIGHYTKLMEIMRKKEWDYSDDKLEQFKEHSMQFFQSWVGLYGAQGVTNYIHMIGFGHILVYMRKYGNLNRFSQQSWKD